MEHGIEYCFECSEYPCQIYEHADDYDSFITHINQKADMQKAKEMGIETYSAEQVKKVELLEVLLSEYNSGREKTLFCLAVNLLDIEDVEKILQEANQSTANLPLKEKARFVANILRETATGKNIELKLRKK